MKKVLPMGKPLINSFPQHGHIFSITSAQSDNYIPWVYNSYVQLYARAHFNTGLRIEYAIPDSHSRIFGVKRDVVSKELALEAWGGIINFARCYIDHDFYVYGLLDVSQISAYRMQHFFAHSPLLYGYDDEKEEIYFADNYGNGSYSTGVATYQEVVAAEDELQRNQGGISGGFCCLKYNAEEFRFQFEKELYRDLLIDYIEQKDSYGRWLKPGFIRKADDHRRWGIGIYSLMQKYLDHMLQEGRRMDQRGFYIQKEHKKLLQQSIAYVLGNNWKLDHPLEWEMMENDVRITEIMLGLCLKYNITRNPAIPERIREYLIKIEENERKLFPKLIEYVDKTEMVKGISLDA